MKRRRIVEGPLTIEVVPEHETCRVRLGGELDLIGAPTSNASSTDCCPDTCSR